MTDVELLNQHRNGSDSAFTDLVRRHLGWVYGLARRRLRDSHQADDVAQAVFILLHSKAPHFAGDGSLIAWLHKTAWYVTETAARGEQRRRVRETEAAKIRPSVDSLEPKEWQELAPLLDRLIDELSKSDREIILLRYYRELSIEELAAQIQTTPGAARKRVERAVEKLRVLAAKSGQTLSEATLSAGLAAFVKLAPPSGLLSTATVAAGAPQGSALAAPSIRLVKGALTMMTVTKLKIVGVCAFAIVLAGATIGGATWMIAGGQTAQDVAQSPATAPSPDADNTPQPPPPQLPPPSPYAADSSIPKLAPYSSLRWRGDIPEAEVNGTWYELVSVQGVPVSHVINFQQSHDPNGWRKHFGEDLVEVMSNMNYGLGTTVDLQVRTFDQDKKLLTLSNLPMTEQNRWSLMVVPAPGQTGLFSAIRWDTDLPQVQVNDTWYELLGINHTSAHQLIDSTKSKFVDDWKNNFQDNVMTVISDNGKPPSVADLKLRTLDTNEQVTITVWTPSPGRN
jgi:RNA polymerase sigma factor (sigma-70 family)